MKLLKELNTMSSKEIADVTGKRHDHVMRDCKELNETYDKLDAPKLGEVNYKANNGQMQPMFMLDKMQVMDLLTGYNVELRIKVNRRWQELELGDAPKTLPEALHRYADAIALQEKTALKLKQQDEEIKALAPLANAYETISNSNRLSSVSQVSALFGTGRNRFYRMLKKLKFVMSNHKPYQDYISKGLFDYKVDEKNGKQYYVTLITGKGIMFLQKTLAEKEYLF